MIPFLGNVTFPVVSANINTSSVDRLTRLFNKSTILDVSGDKVAVVGYTTTETPDVSNTGTLFPNTSNIGIHYK